MKFCDYPYTRPDEARLLADLDQVRQDMELAKDYAAFYQAFENLDAIKRTFATARSLCNVRHSIDTRNPFYDQEQEYFSKLSPKYQHALTEVYKTMMNSPFIEQLKKEIPQTFFDKVENARKTTSEEIIADLQLESSTQDKYTKLIASAQIPFDGNVYTLAGLEEKMNDQDEEVRKRAHKAYWGWFEENEEALGDIFDQLVKIRTRLANTLGYDTFTPVGYMRMNRLDYDQNDVEVYRKNVLQDVVPAARALYQEQAKRLDKDTLKTWNEKVDFLDGNPRPHFSKEVMVKHARVMYNELSPETGAFFQKMADEELMDLEAKPGKRAGGFCTTMPDFHSPFILANFNRTAHDAEVLCHEAGHAFQSWCSSDIFPIDITNPTHESCEIHSMAMEFFTWPWMEGFFESDADKYRYQHLAGAVKFIPYGVLVDHFQHEVYAHPEWSHKERMDAWRKLEKQYLPHKDYDEIDVLERGGWWMRQLHIFIHPFYYIDYTLAQTCALQFWKRTMDKDPQAFEDYKAICKTGGTLPFKQIVEKAHLKDPFSDRCLKETMDTVLTFYDEHPINFL